MAKGKKTAEAKIKVTDGGSLKKVGKQAEQSASKFDQFGKSAHSADRAGRGVAQMSSNSTKNFSKLSQGITGGLVPAYATLAAQLFAIDALFRFLKDAADFRVLKEGQQAFAASTGTAYKALARDIQMATDAQITYADASQAAAIGMAAGLSPDQLTQLSDAAKTVSIALGRDTTDSFNRLVRGVTKAEPELLDELGIVLRLEEASIRYAAALGLNKNELTVFQKSQAVTNEVLRQAEEKFGGMNAVMDTQTNQIAKMAIAMDEVMNTVKDFIAPFIEFFGTFLANNINLAATAIGVFAASIVKTLLPPLRQVDVQMQRSFMSKRFTDPTSGIMKRGEDGTAQAARFDRFAQGKETKRDLYDLDVAINAKQSKILNYENFKRGEAKKTQYQLRALSYQHVADQSTGFARIRAQWKVNLNLMKADYGAFMGTIKAYSMAAGQVVNWALGAIGWISMAIMGFMMLYQKFHKKTLQERELDKYKKDLDDATESIKSLNKELDSIAYVSETGAITDITQQFIRMGNAINSANIAKKLKELNVFWTMSDLDMDAFGEWNQEFLHMLDNMGRIMPEWAKFKKIYEETGRFTAEQRVEMRKLATETINVGQAAKSLTEVEAKLVKERNKMTQALPKIPFQDYIRALDEQIDALDILVEKNSAYNAQLRRVRAELAMMNIVQEQGVALQKLQVQIASDSIFGGMAGYGYVAKQNLVVDKQRVKLHQELQKLANAERQYNDMSLSQREKEGKALKQQIDLQKQLIDQEKTRLVQITLQNDAFFSGFEDLYKGLEKDLGSAFGAALRREDGAFDKIGENMAKTMTDALGEMLARRMLESIFPSDWTPAGIAKQVKDKLGDQLSEFEETFIYGSGQIGVNLKKFVDDFDSRLKIASNLLTSSLRDEDLEAALNTIKERQRQAAEILPGRVGSAEYNAWRKHMGEDRMGTYMSSLDLQGQDNVRRAQWRIERLFKLAQEITPMVEAETSWTGNNRFTKKKTIDVDAVHKGVIDAGYGTELADIVVQHLDGTVSDAGPRIAKALVQEINEDLSDPTLYDRLRVKTGKFGEVILNKTFDEMSKTLDSFTVSDTEFNTAIETLYGKMGYGTGAEQTLDERNLEQVESLKVLKTQLEEAGFNTEKLTDEMLEEIAAISTLNLTLQQFDAWVRKIMSPDGSTPDPEPKPGGGGDGDGGNGGDGGDAATEGDPKWWQFGKRIKQRREENKNDEAAETQSAAANTMYGATHEFLKGTGQFLGIAGTFASLTGDQETAAKIMKLAAFVQLQVAIMEMSTKILDFFGSREGGILSPPGYRSFDTGGVASGPSSGYPVTLHGTEAVVPLPNNREIPVHLTGGTSSVNNTTVNVNMGEGGVSSDTRSDAAQGRALGEAINSAVLVEIQRQQQSGGLLDTTRGG